jgi:hypothetical protein
MLFNDELLFLHVPKAAGTSVTSYLIRSLPGQITLTEPADRLAASDRVSVFARAKLGLRRLRRHAGLLRRPQLKLIEGTRHENLREASEVLRRMGRRLEDFRMILAIVRNPYELEVSRYHFFRRGHFGVQGLAHELAEELAQAGDFATFARLAPYHGRLPGRIEEWFEIDSSIPQNLRILRFENLQHELAAAVDALGCRRVPLPNLNTSVHGPYTDYMTREIEQAIYEKFRWPFDRGFYPRLQL